LVLFSCFVAYKIKHRNRKGQYFAHIEEGDNSGIKTIKGKIKKINKNSELNNIANMNQLVDNNNGHPKKKLKNKLFLKKISFF
jgi:hypothetical protein